jgi:hypothetical protein
MSYTSFGWVGENREIKLVQKEGIWKTVHFIDGQPDQKLIKLHKTNELPTPWADSTDRATVVAALSEINPHAKIE